MRSLTVYNLLSAAVLIGITAGCGWDSATDPRLHAPDWDVVRYQAGIPGEEPGLDLTVMPDGRLSMNDTRGEAVSLWGLLAGGNLETLVRLLDSLPPNSYSSDFPCPIDDGFVVTVSRGNAEFVYASNLCDQGAPSSLTNLRLLFEEMSGDVVAPRARIVAYQILAEGLDSDISREGTEIVQDRDEFIELIRSHRKNGPVALPRVDFERQFVVAEFLGEKRGTLHGVTVNSAELTDGGWLRIMLRTVEPLEECAGVGAVTRPYVLVAIERASTDLLVQTEVVRVPCGGGGLSQ